MHFFDDWNYAALFIMIQAYPDTYFSLSGKSF
jgi:hypothetical protein